MIDTDIPGSFGSVQRAATWLEDLAGAMQRAGDDALAARRAAAAGWDGPSHDAYAAHVTEVVSAGDRRAGVVRRCARAVETYAWELQACQSEMDGHRARAAEGGLTVSGTRILPPAPALHPGPPLLMPTPAQQGAYDDAQRLYDARMDQQRLYDRLCLEVRATYDRLDDTVRTTLAPAQREAAEPSGLAALLAAAKTVADRLGDGVGFGEAVFTVRERDLRRAAERSARALAARRSGNPAVRSGTKAPSARGLANAQKPGTRYSRLWTEADEAARWGKYLKWGGPVIAVAGAGLDLARGESPGKVGAGLTGGLLGGALAGAAVTGGAALLGVSAPVIVVGGAAVLGGYAAAKGAEWLWDNAVPDDVKDAIDDGAREAWDWTTDTASDAWDGATDAVSGAWNSVFG